MDWLICVLSHEAFRGLVILLGVVVAIVSVMTARALARKKQAADLLFASRGDEQMQRGCQTVRKLHVEKGKNLFTMLDDDEHKTEFNDILYVLNHFETVSVGLRNGIYCENMMKDAWCTIMVSTYDFAAPVVKSMRTRDGKNTAFQEYELLVARWKASPLKTRTKWKQWWEFWK